MEFWLIAASLYLVMGLIALWRRNAIIQYHVARTQRTIYPYPGELSRNIGNTREAIALRSVAQRAKNRKAGGSTSRKNR